MLKVHNPYTNELIKELQLENLEEIEQKTDKLYSNFKDKSNRLKPFERIVILEKLVQLLIVNYQKIINIAISEGGKPLNDTIIEMDRAIDGVKLAILSLRYNDGQKIPMGVTKSSINKLAYTDREPIGVVLAFSAFNHPINLIIHQVIPAFAVGSPVIIKPAPTTPLTCELLVSLFYKAGFRDIDLQMILCDNQIASQIVSNNKISYFSFIGNAEVGWMLAKKLNNGVRYGLEHGGIAPILIADDINNLDKTTQTNDLFRIAQSVIKGAFYHSGQVCVSTQRLYLPKNISAEFLEIIIELTNKLIVGDPNSDNTNLGPLIKSEALDKFDLWINEAINTKSINSKTKLLCGGKRLDNNCFEPTIILNPDGNSKLITNEVFGPILSIIEYEDINSAIEKINSTDYIFHSAIFTNNIPKALKYSELINGTGIIINDHTAFRTDWMPFGGAKLSGMGIGGIEYSMNEYSYPKLKVINYNY